MRDQFNRHIAVLFSLLFLKKDAEIYYMRFQSVENNSLNYAVSRQITENRPRAV